MGNGFHLALSASQHPTIDVATRPLWFREHDAVRQRKTLLTASPASLLLAVELCDSDLRTLCINLDATLFPPTPLLLVEGRSCDMSADEDVSILNGSRWRGRPLLVRPLSCDENREGGSLCRRGFRESSMVGCRGDKNEEDGGGKQEGELRTTCVSTSKTPSGLESVPQALALPRGACRGFRWKTPPALL